MNDEIPGDPFGSPAPGNGNGHGGDGLADQDLTIGIRGVQALPSEEPGQLDVELETTRGAVRAHLHPREGKTGCAIFIGGAAGGVEGPANQVYLRLSRDLIAQGVTSIRVEYRQPGEFAECVLDALVACSFLKGLGAGRAVIIGHSFGGAVAIKAAELAPLASAVVGMSSQRFGTQTVERLRKPLLLIHGADDDVLLPQASEDIFERALEPKQLVVLPGAGHSLREVPDEVYQLLFDYITEQVGDAAAF